MAIRTLEQAKKQDEVARLIGVTRQTISLWMNKTKKVIENLISTGLRVRKNGDKKRLNKAICEKRKML